MTISFNDAELAVLSSGVQNIAAFFRMETDPVIRLWLGFGYKSVGANVLDPDGAVYRGFGELINLPEFNQMINGAAERVQFTLSGVSGEVLQLLASGDADQIKGKPVSVGIGILGSQFELLGAVHWMASYRVDVVSIRQDPSGPGAPIVRTVAMSCGTLLTSRRRPGLAYFSNEDQQTRFPGDTFCEYTPKYAANFNKAWPRF